MKKFLIFLTVLVLIVLTLNHGTTTLSAAGDNIYAAYLKDCDPGTVRLKESDSFGLTTAMTIEGRNCAGINSAYQGYRAEIWDHFFWLL